MDKVVYGLCVGTSLLCTVMLFRAYLTDRLPLLLWSGLCFCLLTLSNGLLYADFIIFVNGPDLSLVRNTTTLAGLGILIYGLIFRTS